MNWVKEKQNYFPLFIAILFFFLSAYDAKAEITHPYTIDEKPKVLFGDTVVVSTSTLVFEGLENYTQNYVNGFAHFTFTYTHHSCCYASYPPRIYITNVDPRSTGTPIEKSTSVAYALTPFWGGFGEPTDWYSYDIQFDSTGYRVIVKQAGITEISNIYTNVPDQVETDWIAIANRHPKYDPPTLESMSFTPVPIKEPLQTIDPVIIIPGIMGSAYKNGELVIDPILHTYDDLIATLVANGYVKGVDLFTFPYEWRDSNVLTAAFLRNKINQIQEICNCNKVDIVAHSMGGLVARQYIQSDNYGDDVDQIIFLGTPHKGAATDYLQWEAGEFPPDFDSNFRKLFFQAEALRNGYPRIFDYIHNRPILSVQELLPIFNYIKDDSSGDIREYPNNYPRNVFLESLNTNLGIQKLINSGVKIENIIGNSGEDKTINIIRVVPTNHSTFWEHGEPEDFGAIIGDHGLERGSGDNTVTPHSASIENSIPNQNSNSSHGRIPTVEASNIYNLLTGKISIINIDTGTNIDPKILMLQLLSPIDFIITAPDGKRVGKNFETGGEYEEIENAFYSGYQTEEEYITILNPMDGEYEIELQGTGDGGEYGVLTSYISDGFATTTQTIGITAPNQITNLNIEINNANLEELGAEREVTLDVIINDINGAYNLGWITDKKVRDSLLKQAKAIIKFEQKRPGKFEKKVDKILIKLLQKELDLLLKKGKISSEAYKLLKTDLEYLLINN